MRITNLLWTGGWDSTFRLLQLLTVHRYKVQTHYIIDENRLSFKAELKAMEKIRNKILRKFPESDRLFFPVITYDLSKIHANNDITMKFKKALSHVMGEQYEFLIRYTVEFGLNDIELCIQNDQGRVGNFLKPYLFSFEKNGLKKFRLIDRPVHEDISILKYFTYPVFALSKLEMKKNAKKNEFDDIMEMTRFCHKPIKDNACGICVPCQDAVNAGLGYRIPYKGHIRYWLHQINWRLKKNLKDNNQKSYK